MSNYTVKKLDEIPKRDTWIPVRDELGIGAFGVNAYRAEEAGGRVISPHTELMAKHEELYVVVEGHATFTVAGDEIDAPTGMCVYISDPTVERGAVASAADTIVLSLGGWTDKAFVPSEWEVASFAE